MRIDVLTLFPSFFTPLIESGVTGRAHHKSLWSLHCWDPRQYVHNVHRTVDDRPYGGGPGMVMLAEPLQAALKDAQAARQADTSTPAVEPAASLATTHVILLSPSGERFTQRHAHDLVATGGAIFVCGRYEGIDQRFIDQHVTHEYSLGDFVLSGGEVAAMAMIDSAARLVPGALHSDQSAAQDSFHESNDGLLDSPHYTRPEDWQGQAVPEVLLSGNHRLIERWRREQALKLSWQRRPDLIHAARQQQRLSAQDEAYLQRLMSAKNFFQD